MLPCTAGWSLLSRGLCWSFLGSLTLPSVLQRLVWPSLSPLSSSSMSWGLFVFLSAPWPALWAVLFVCAEEVCMPLLSWHPWPTLCTMGLPCASLGSLSPLSAHGHSPWGFYGLRSTAFSVFCPLGLCFIQFFWDSTALTWTQLSGNFPVQGNTSCFMTPCLPPGQKLPHLEVLHLFPFYVSILSPTSFQGV